AAPKSPKTSAAAPPAANFKRWRSQLHFVIRQLPQSRAVAIDDVGIIWRVVGIRVLLPREVNLLSVTRKADGARLIAGERGTPHNAVDRQRELPGGNSLRCRALPLK